MEYLYLYFIIFLIGAIVTVAKCADNFNQLCQNSNDITSCVRNFFANRADCTVIQTVNNDPLYRERHNTYLPKVNLTLVTTQATIRNLNGNIEEFYINRDTNNLVMTVNFKGIIFDSPVTYFFISQRGLEPKMLYDHVNGTYPAVLTAVIPANCRITVNTLRRAVVSAYLPRADVEYYIGPKITGSTDPVVSAVLEGIIADESTAVQEIFLTESPNFFLAYLQKYICDFGIPLSY